MVARPGSPTDVAGVLERLARPARAVVTAGMPYANGPVHLGHLAGAHLPADIHARWLGMLIGRDNVLFVSGTDDHGSISELTAMQAGQPIEEYIAGVREGQTRTLDRYHIDLDIYSGTSHPDCLPIHTELCQDFIRRLHANGLIKKVTTPQWYDPEAQRFLSDRLVRGRCPNPDCDNEDAYGDECDRCGRQYDPTELQDPRSMVSEATPEMRDTAHLWLDMWAVSERLQEWIESKRKTWRPVVLTQVLETVKPKLQFDRDQEESYKELAKTLPKHKRRYTPGKRVVLQFESKSDLATAQALLSGAGIDSELLDKWGHRPITRDIAWGIPLPDIDPELAGKTLYVWPDSLIAPISFSQLALARRGQSRDEYADYWRNPSARVYQFVGQDNVFFYVLMQGAMWLGINDDPLAMPGPSDLQLTDVLGAFHLMIEGSKMSKSRGNFFSGDQLLDERGYDADQIRYYLALLGLAEKPSDFEFAKLDDRNRLLASKLNSAFERPISAAHSKFGGRVPEGQLVDKVEADTVRMVQRYVRAMEKVNYPSMLFELENYARTINVLFTKYKPHDDRHPLISRANALFSAFYVLKNLMIMLYPFVPATMDRLRDSLRLPADVFRVDELGKPLPAGHEVGEKQPYFPSDR